VRIPKKKLPIIANLVEEQEEVIAKDEHRGANLGFETTVKFGKISHFIKGKILKLPWKPFL
jgi:hypothetical protein